MNTGSLTSNKIFQYTTTKDFPIKNIHLANMCGRDVIERVVRKNQSSQRLPTEMQ